MARKFESVSLPSDLIDLVDEFLNRNNLGYGTRPEVINEAIRRFIREEMPELREASEDESSDETGTNAEP